MSSLPEVPRFGKIVGDSPGMRTVFELIERAARFDVPVLICGETGTGKDLIAGEIHARSHRASGVYVPVNMGILSRELVLSELFGHVKGAFTGAATDKRGRFREASGGTLFLDEIGTTTEHVQITLLRVLEQHRCRAVGGDRDYEVNARIIAASNIDLDTTAAQNRFRRDLLHRLGVFRIDVPALRDRREDLPYLIAHSVNRVAEEYGREVTGFGDEAFEALLGFDWPGNVRELYNVIAQAVLVAGRGRIELDHLPRRVTGQDSTWFASLVRADDERRGFWVTMGQSLGDVQKMYVMRTLDHCDSNKAQAARILGISRKTLYDRLQGWDA